MNNVNKVDCALFPPCAKTVVNKVQQAHFISIIVWGNADLPHPGQGLDPLNYGWKDKDGCYAPDWFSGPAVPHDLFHEELEDDTVEDTQSNQPDVASELDDTETLDSELP